MSQYPPTPASGPLPSNTFAGVAEPLFIQAGGGGGATVLGNTQINGTLGVTGATTLTTAVATGFVKSSELIVSGKGSSSTTPQQITAAPGLSTAGTSGNFKCANFKFNFSNILTLTSAVVTINNADTIPSPSNPAPVQMVSTYCNIPGMTLTAINSIGGGSFDFVFTPIVTLSNVVTLTIGISLLVV